MEYPLHMRDLSILNCAIAQVVGRGETVYLRPENDIAIILQLSANICLTPWHSVLQLGISINGGDMKTSIVGHVYRVRTECSNVLGHPDNPPFHCAKKGSLAVILASGQYDGRRGFYCQVVGLTNGKIRTQHLRPCDLKRLEDHDYINEVGK